MSNPQPRTASVERTTSETTITAAVNLDGTGEATVSTGLGFFDHMLTALSKHSRINLELQCKGDLEVDDHHTIEDCALTIGQAIDQALADRRGVRRFAHAYAPLDEALARTVVDLSGRPWATAELDLKRDSINGVSCEMLPHFFWSLAVGMRATLHVDVLRGANDHHKAEAAFKATAIALRDAVRLDGDAVPSTKGVL